jgi:hypothetical protein
MFINLTCCTDSLPIKKITYYNQKKMNDNINMVSTIAGSMRVSLLEMFINLTCINRTLVYSKHVCWSQTGLNRFDCMLKYSTVMISKNWQLHNMFVVKLINISNSETLNLYKVFFSGFCLDRFHSTARVRDCLGKLNWRLRESNDF